jgi:pimeloyl-ACP methyl ester carboxylesterase
MTSIMSTPSGGSVARATAGEPAEGDLPGPTQELLKVFAEVALAPPRTREERIEQQVRLFTTLAGSLAPLDLDLLRAQMTLAHDRAPNPEAANNHGLALQDETDRRPELRKLDIPALVIHGTEDPILPYQHGVATAEAIPGAELLTIEKMGHDLPEATWPTICDAILRISERG